MTDPEGTRRARPRTGGGRSRRGEQPMVPAAEFRSYYGRPVLKAPVWKVPDVPVYLFLGGLAGASSLLGTGAAVTRRQRLAQASRLAAAGAGLLSLITLIHDLGRPARFLNMLRMVKVTSPLSLGSWLLAGYVPAATVAAAAAVTGRVPRIGAAAAAVSTALSPVVASYTAALISDTAVPAWHEGYREMPFVFAGSAAAAAGGLGLVAAPLSEHGPARTVALLGVAGELSAFRRLERRLGMLAEPYRTGVAGRYLRTARMLSLAGSVTAITGQRYRLTAAVAGAALLAASLATRFGVFFAGMASARNPRYTVQPQRERLRGTSTGSAGARKQQTHTR